MTVRYLLDPRQSRFTVQAFAKGMLSVFAHNPIFAVRDFTGELRFTPDTFEDASFRIVVRADSLELIGNVPERDRPEVVRAMRTEVLETATYPEIKFESTEFTADRIAANWYRLRLRGGLALHGVTRPHPVEAQLRILEDGVRLGGEFPLSQAAFKIKPVSAVGGMITLKDELKCSFDVVGQKEG